LHPPHQENSPVTPTHDPTDQAQGPPASAARGIRPLSLRRNFLWTYVGNMVYSVSQWGILMVLAKLGSSELVGAFALAMAINLPITMLCGLSLNALQVTDAKEAYAFGHYLGLRIIGVTVATVVASAIGLIAYPPGLGLLIVLVSLNQAAQSIREIFLAAMRKRERMDYVSTAKMLTGALYVASFIIILYAFGSLPAAIGASVLLRVGVMVLYDRPRVNRLLAAYAAEAGAQTLRPIFDLRPLWELVKLGLPLGIVMMIISFESNIPRYLIEAYRGKKVLGYFAAVAVFVQVGRFVVQSLGQAASPRLAKYYLRDVAAYRRLLIKLMAVGFVVGLAGIAVAALIGRTVLTLMYTAEYAEFSNVLVRIMVACCVMYVGSFLGYAMTAARYLKIQVPIGLAVAATTLIASWLLIGPYGLMGAANVLVLAACVRLLTQAVVVAYAIRRRARAGAQGQSPPDSESRYAPFARGQGDSR